MNQTDPTAAVWIDGDPLMEAIAAAIWEHCETEGTSLVVDDPRNIAAVVSAVVSPPTDRADLRDRIVAEVERLHETGGVYALDAGEPERIAAAVLAVLPEPTDRAAVERDRYRAAWQSARERAQAYGEGILRHVADRDFWKRQHSAEHARHVEVVRTLVTDRAAVLTAAERAMLTYALDQAQEKIWSEDGFTDEDQAAVDSLRRLAVEHSAGAQQQPDTEARCDAGFVFGGRCTKPAGHQPPGSDDPHVPAPVVEQPAAEARLARYQTCGVCSAGYETGSHCTNCEFHARMALEAAAADDEETLCRCGHGKNRHAPDVHGNGTCADCPGDEERSWRHPFTPATTPRS